MKKKKAAAKAKAKAGSKADKLERGIKPKKAKAPKAAKPSSRGDAAADAVESIAIGIASAVGAAVAEGIGMAMRSVAAVANNAVTYERTDKTEPATPPLEDTPSNVMALGQATGALGNKEFITYLNARGITDGEIGEVRDALLKLARAFYVDPEGERE